MQPTRDVVVVGASAGGVEALRSLVSGLPADFPAAVIVVLHVPAVGTSVLPAILTRAGRLPARQAWPDAEVRPGRILVAPPDHHVVVYDGRLTLSHGPRENGHRPAVDVLFRTAARTLGPRVVGVVLSGTLDDGTAGLVAIRSRGGVGVVQDPDDALHGAMPRNAIEGACPEHVLSVDDMPMLLDRLVRQPVDPYDAPPPTELMELEAAMADLDPAALDNPDRPGDPSGLSCPECGGSLFNISEGGLVRFRCRVGHAWSPDSLAAQQSTALESALWMAMRSLEERAALTDDMASRAMERGHSMTAQGFQRERDEARSAALLVRDLIEDMSGAQGRRAAPEVIPAGEPTTR